MFGKALLLTLLLYLLNVSLRADAVTYVPDSGDWVLDSDAILEFKLDTVGIAPIEVTGDLMVDPASRIVIDGSDYEALDGYFPLITVAGSLEGFAPENVSFVGFDAREPHLITDYNANGLWLRLLAPPSLSEHLQSLVPASTVTADYAGTEFAVSRAYDPTESSWTPTFDEAHVMDTRLFQTVTDGSAGAANRSWELTLGRAGQIASFRSHGTLGETVPPSWRSDLNSSPWQDEVWQGVAIDTVLNNLYDDSPYFIHQAGVYLNKDPIVEKPFSSPQVAAYLDESDRSFTTINWGQQAHLQVYINEETADDWHSDLLYLTKVRDLGQGVIEVSLGFYNYGTDLPNYFNMPWGGVRRSSMEYAFFLDASGSAWTDALEGAFGEGLSMKYDEVGGVIAWSDSVSGESASLGLVFGFDPDPLFAEQSKQSLIRYGYAGGTDTGNETDWRNYYVISAIRRYNLSQGKGVWARYYFVLGDNLTDLKSRITARDLVASATLTEFDYSEATSPLVGYRMTGSGTGFRVVESAASADFYLYAHPVGGSFPIYEIIESDSSRYLTWNPYASGVIKTYDGTIAGIRLLGFALRTTDINDDSGPYSYAALDTIMAGFTGHYMPSGESLSVRTSLDVNLPAAVAHWSMDHADGSEATDVSGNGNHATVSGATWDVGVEGGALNFDGDGDTVLLPQAAFSSITSEVSISMWAYGSTSQPAKDTVFYAMNADGERMLNIHLPWANSQVYWDAGYAGGYDRISALAAVDDYKGQWNHWVFTKNATTGEMKIYLNGALWHSGTNKNKMLSGITEGWVGSSDQMSSESYSGLLDEVMLYDVELTEAEITGLYRAYTLPQDYSLWLQNYPTLEDHSFAADPEKDGIATGIEYVLNGIPTVIDQTILPVLDVAGDNFVFNFTRNVDAVSFTTQVFQYSSNLEEWTNVRISSPIDQSVRLGEVSDGLQQVTVIVSKDAAVGGKLFGRLGVELIE